MVPANTPEAFTFSPDPQPPLRTAAELLAINAEPHMITRSARARAHSVWDQRLALVRLRASVPGAHHAEEVSSTLYALNLQLACLQNDYPHTWGALLNATRAWARQRARRSGLPLHSL